MLKALIYKVRIGSVGRQMRMIGYRFGEHRESFVFFLVLALPLMALSFIVYFAYSSRIRVQPTPVKLDAAQQRALDLRCLAENIYFEARGEPIQGQYAVAEVTMNRLSSPYFPDSICEVVHDTRWDPARRRYTAHFSWTGLDIDIEPSGLAWRKAMAIATAVYDDAYVPVVPEALFYHTTDIHPYWADSKQVIATIGNHIFYR
jgi:spore germination cell wall hydrolase CwlJ-like protein